jgi:multiple sugar transport system ATP-binding protein
MVHPASFGAPRERPVARFFFGSRGGREDQEPERPFPPGAQATGRRRRGASCHRRSPVIESDQRADAPSGLDFRSHPSNAAHPHGIPPCNENKCDAPRPTVSRRGGEEADMASVDVRGVHKAYGLTKVIHGVDIPIQDGEFVILVGPSGCGKSTLLRMIAGLENITGGEIAIGDRVVNNVPPKERDIAMVFQNYALYPHMTVADNMAFSLKLRSAPKDEIRTRVDKAAKILGLEKLLDRYPRQLSGGQRQRVAMGRAIVRDPQVFLFDEPLSNLDAKLRVQMRTEIKELHQRLKTTTIYVTHDQIEAMTMADKIVVMHDGIVEQMGAPLDLYDKPSNIFVAGFIGSPAMNFVRGNITSSGFRDGSGASWAIGSAPAGSDGKPAVLGIRPEHIRLDPKGVKAKVHVIEPTGSETQVVVDVNGQNLTCVFRERITAKPGEMISIAPDKAVTHLFDEGSGKRLN